MIDMGMGIPGRYTGKGTSGTGMGKVSHTHGTCTHHGGYTLLFYIRISII